MPYTDPVPSSSSGAAVVLLIALCAPGSVAVEGQDTLVDGAIAAYESGDYQEAVTLFKSAIRAAPEVSFLHHWLGKCYGRIAEHGSWFRAPGYSQKALKQFRRAVELDDSNHDALRDLISYLEKAPGFLGGDKREAERLRPRLAALKNAHENNIE